MSRLRARFIEGIVVALWATASTSAALLVVIAPWKSARADTVGNCTNCISPIEQGFQCWDRNAPACHNYVCDTVFAPICVPGQGVRDPNDPTPVD